MPKRHVTDGGRALRKYLDASGESVSKFASRAHVDRAQVIRVMNGERWQRVTVDFAYACEVATGRRIAIEQFLSRTARERVMAMSTSRKRS